MGRYLSCGIAETIYINSLKDGRKDEEALTRIGENIDLKLKEKRLTEFGRAFFLFNFPFVVP